MKPLKSLFFVFLIVGGILISAQNTKAQTGYLSSFLEVIDGTVFGQSETILYNYSFGYYYTVGVDGLLYDQNQNLLASNSQQRVSQYARAPTAVYGAVRGNNYKLISYHTAYAQYVRYSEDQQVFLYQDPSGISEFGQIEHPSPYQIQTSYSREIVNETIDLGRTSVTLQVPLVAPQLTSIDVDAGIPGGNPIQTYLRGSNLFGTDRYIIVSGGGGVNITLQPLTNSTDVVDVNIQIDSSAPLGDRQISLVVDGQTSNSIAFRVGDRSPTIISINPSELSPGESALITITETNFGTNPTLSVDCCSVNVSQQTTNAAGTQIQAVFSVNNSAGAGIRNVTVTSNGISGMGFQSTGGEPANSNSIGFEVVASASQPTITEVGVVEKNNLKEVTVSNPSAAANDKTKFRIRRLSGTGSATFEDGTTETQEFTGAVSSRTLRIKGVTESSQANNFVIEALVNGSSKLQKSFTVATIMALVFENFDSNYSNIDSNPGNGQTGSAGGRRIFPDKKDVADVNSGTTDRALVKVIATVSPTIPNVQVYFGSYDLDDPSANAAPLDTNASVGDDNNGAVNSSKSGDFVSPSGITCTASTPAVVGRIGCTVASGGTATAAFKTTMQPGDNFAVAASLTDTYRDSITLNSSDGSKLTDSANKTIPISGEANTDNAAGIRTEMLTVWRSLHIEVDSMGNVSGNSVTGTIASNLRGVTRSQITLTLSVSTLEPNRFENGRLVIGSSSYGVINSNPAASPPVDANTSNTVTIINTGTFSVSYGDSFTLYDDDDMDDEDVGNLNGDQGDNVPEPDLGLLTPNEVSCSNTFNTNNCNVFVSAYVQPTYDLSGSHEDIPFYTNTSSSSLANIRTSYFQNKMYEANTDFWTIYLLGAYQFESSIDGDPDSSGAIFGFKDGPGTNDGEGAVIFNEVGRPREYENMNTINPVDWRMRPVSRRFTVAHEVGHLFGGDHDDYNPGTMEAGIMADSLFRTSPLFSNTTINKIRGGTMLYHP